MGAREIQEPTDLDRHREQLQSAIRHLATFTHHPHKMGTTTLQRGHYRGQGEDGTADLAVDACALCESLAGGGARFVAEGESAGAGFAKDDAVAYFAGRFEYGI